MQNVVRSKNILCAAQHVRYVFVTQTVLLLALIFLVPLPFSDGCVQFHVPLVTGSSDLSCSTATVGSHASGLRR